MIKNLRKISSFLFALYLVLLPLISQPAQAAESSKQTSLSKEEMKKHAFNNGKLIKALDSKEVNEVLKKGVNFSGKIDGAPIVINHTFDDGSSFEIKTSVNGANHSPSKNGSIGTFAKERDRTAETSYTAKGAAGIEIWTYTIYQDFSYNGTDITWFEKSPYSGYETTPILNFWDIVSEGPMYTEHSKTGDGITAYANPKLKFSVWEIVNVQTISFKVELHINPNGTYYGTWKRL